MYFLSEIYVKKGHAAQLAKGYPWVFQRHLAKHFSLQSFTQGQWVRILSEDGKFIGVGTCDPEAEILIRVFALRDISPDEAIKKALENAINKRDKIFNLPYYRLIYSEADQIPGCIVDRFGNYLVIQINTHGIWNLKDVVVKVIRELIDCDGILIRADSRQARREGLDCSALLIGEIPQYIAVWEDDRQYFTMLGEGQKTGWFYDQRMNHRLAASFANKGSTVLDLFSYQGGFGLACALKGAAVTLVDQSEAALAVAKYAFDYHHLEASFIKADAFEYLADSNQQFDIVIIDPPAMMTNKTHYKKATNAYQRLIQDGIKKVKKGGWFVFASCSAKVKFSHLSGWVLQSSQLGDVKLKLIYQTGHDKDHPVHPQLPTTAYLKCGMWQVV